MATQEQLNTVRKLHELNDRTLGGYADGQYDIAQPVTKTKNDAGVDILAFGDPYEAYNAKIAGGTLALDITVDTVAIIGESNPTEAQMTGGLTYTATVTFFNAVGGEDDSVTWSINNLGSGNTSTYSIASETGVAGAVSTATQGDTFDVVATSNFDGTTIGTLNILVEPNTP